MRAEWREQEDQLVLPQAKHQLHKRSSSAKMSHRIKYTKLNREKLMGCERMDKYNDLLLQTEGNMCTLSRLISDHPCTTLTNSVLWPA